MPQMLFYGLDALPDPLPAMFLAVHTSDKPLLQLTSTFPRSLLAFSERTAVQRGMTQVMGPGLAVTPLSLPRIASHLVSFPFTSLGMNGMTSELTDPNGSRETRVRLLTRSLPYKKPSLAPPSASFISSHRELSLTPTTLSHTIAHNQQQHACTLLPTIRGSGGCTGEPPNATRRRKPNFQALLSMAWASVEDWVLATLGRRR